MEVPGFAGQPPKIYSPRFDAFWPDLGPPLGTYKLPFGPVLTHCSRHPLGLDSLKVGIWTEQFRLKPISAFKGLGRGPTGNYLVLFGFVVFSFRPL